MFGVIKHKQVKSRIILADKGTVCELAQVTDIRTKVNEDLRKSIMTGKIIRNDSTKEVNNGLGIVKMETYQYEINRLS